MIKQIEKMLLEGNMKFQWKLSQDIEKINLEGKIPKYPALILTCMDSRIDVHRIFQLNLGDVFILRNAGNICTMDSFRTILIAIIKYNIKLVIVLGHLDCGMTKIDLRELREKVFSNYSIPEIRDFFKPFMDEFANIRKQVNSLRDFEDLPSDVEITGMIYDMETGWVFENELIKDLKFVENFKKNYRRLLDKKQFKFIDYLEAEMRIDENLNEKRDNIEESQNEEECNQIALKNNIEENTSQIDLNNVNSDINPIDSIQMKGLKVPIPKIHFPQIKIHIPTMYRNKIKSGLNE